MANRRELIIAKTPLRISFFGGGTDFKSYYQKKGGGVIATSINKYIYVIIKNHNFFFNENFRLSYSSNEKVSEIKDIKNNLVRSVLKYFNIKEKLIINILSDIPSRSGLGSSSACLVALVHSISKYQGMNLSKKKIADIACDIEINHLNSPIGIQDQYATCFGGLKHYQFIKNKISINSLYLSKKNHNILIKNSLLIWTGGFRDSKSILKEQNNNIKVKLNELNEINEIRKESKKFFTSKIIDIKAIGLNLNKSWNLKKKLSSNITNKNIDKIYNLILKNGGIGGKLCGAGSCGFIFFIVEQKKQKYIKSLLPNNYFVDFNLDKNGSEIILEI